MKRTALALLVVCASCTERLELGAREPVEAGVACLPGSSSPLPVRPVDVVFILDNSSSMVDSVRALERGLAATFSPALDGQLVDYRVILLSRYGWLDVGASDFPVCIAAPLGASDCNNPDGTALLHHPPRFFHFSVQMDSHDALCMTLQSFHSSDELPVGERPWTPIAPAGWSEFVRPEAWTTFVLITDGDPACTFEELEFTPTDGAQGFSNASLFDAALSALLPEKFGSAAARRYDWVSVLALDATGPVEPSAPLITANCDGEGGLPYQALSILTGGMRYSLCDPTAIDSVFLSLAADIAQRARYCE